MDVKWKDIKGKFVGCRWRSWVKKCSMVSSIDFWEICVICLWTCQRRNPVILLGGIRRGVFSKRMRFHLYYGYLIVMMQKIAKICKSACNSANKLSFQNPTKSFFAQCSIDVKYVVKVSLHLLHLWGVGQKGFLSDFEKVVYWLNYRPKDPEIADFCYFGIITIR